MRQASLPKIFPILDWMGVLIFMGTPATNAMAPTSFSGPSLNLSVRNQHFSAQVDRMALPTVLSALSAQLPIKFILKGIDQDNLISTSFTGLPIDQGLERLLVGYDYAIMHFPVDHDPSALTSGQRMEVVVLSRNHISSTLGSSGNPVILSPTFSSQYPSTIIHQAPKPEEHPPSLDMTINANEQDVVSLLEQAVEKSDPETPQLIQELLNKSELLNE